METDPTRYRSMPHVEFEDAKEFARLYKERFGVELSDEEASDLADRYVHMFMIITS